MSPRILRIRSFRYLRNAHAIGISPRLVLEPGRYIVCDTGIFRTGVNTVKRSAKNFVGVDVGLDLLIRQAMYDAYQEVVNKAGIKEAGMYDVVGLICESGDIVAKERMLPAIEPGNVIAVLDSGAYRFSIGFPVQRVMRCTEVLVNGGRVDVVHVCEDYGDLTAKNVVPARLLRS